MGPGSALPAAGRLHAALDELMAVLAEERDALVAGQVPGLAALAARKRLALDACASLGALHAQALPRALRLRLREAQQLNALNSRLLAPKLAAARAGLSVLGANRLTYGADGGSHFSSGFKQGRGAYA